MVRQVLQRAMLGGFDPNWPLGLVAQRPVVRDDDRLPRDLVDLAAVIKRHLVSRAQAVACAFARNVFDILLPSRRT